MGGVGGMLTFIALRHQKMLLRWRCCYECFQNGFVDVKRKKAHVHFANGSLVDYDMFMSIKRNLKFQETRNSYRKSKNDKGWWNWKRPKKKALKQRTTYPRYVVRMLNQFLIFSRYRKNTKHCKTQWKVTFFKLEHNELQLPSGEPPASALYIYMCKHIASSSIHMIFISIVSTDDNDHNLFKQSSICHWQGDNYHMNW